MNATLSKAGFVVSEGEPDSEEDEELQDLSSFLKGPFQAGTAFLRMPIIDRCGASQLISCG